MPVRGSKPKDDDRKRFRGGLTHEWVEVPAVPFAGKVPVRLPTTRQLTTKSGEFVSVRLSARAKAWWSSVRKMPHCALWSETDWQFALDTALVADLAARGVVSATAELRQRERVLGTTMDARRDLRIRYVDPGTGSQPAQPAMPADSGKDEVAERRSRRARVTSAS